MEDNVKKDMIGWVKAHKKQLLISGITIASIIGVILMMKNKDSLMKQFEILKLHIRDIPNDDSAVPLARQVAIVPSGVVSTSRAYTSPQDSFDVRCHIRNLSEGKHHSVQKAVEAEKLGVFLLPNQTLVDSYTKCAA